MPKQALAFEPSLGRSALEAQLQMTREQAIAVARDFVIRLGGPVVLEPEDARLMRAAMFNELFCRRVYTCDFWVVDFRKILPPEVAAESPSAIAVEVNPATGEAREVYLGMHSA